MSLLDKYSGWIENNRLELKGAQKGLPKSFWETYSAFANTEGGIIILGVEDASHGGRVLGVTNAEALVQDLWNGLNNAQKVSANLLVDSDVSVERDGGATIVLITVPRADRTQRPVYINDNMNRGTFRRNGEGDYRCSMDAIAAMIRDSTDAPIDKEPLDDIGLDALSERSIREYRTEFVVLRTGHPWVSLQDEEFLLRIGAIGRVKGQGELHPTKAGLLMFGEAWRITDVFPNFFLDCRQESGRRRWDNRITSDSGDWDGNLYDFWYRANRMLCEGLPVPFELGESATRIDETPQHEAIREALTNALVHADYCGRTGIVAIRDSRTVEISNPGCLRLPRDVIEGGGVSDPRNKTLMTMFNLIGRGDKAGSGFDVLRKAAEYAGTELPRIDESLDPDRVKVTLNIEPNGIGFAQGTESDKYVSKIGGITSEDGGRTGESGGITSEDGGRTGESGGITSEDGGRTGEAAGELVLSHMRENPKASTLAIAESTGLSQRKVERTIRKLRESGIVVRVGGPRGHWEIHDSNPGS